MRECPMFNGLDTPWHESPLDGLPDDALAMHILRYWALIIRETGELLLPTFRILSSSVGSDLYAPSPLPYSCHADTVDAHD